MRIAFTGVGGTGKTTLARHVSTTYSWPLNPVGARSTAAAMGFVGEDGTGRPFDVDRASVGAYRYVLENGIDMQGNGKTVQNAARAAKNIWENHQRGERREGPPIGIGGPFQSCRPLFQSQLATDKIAWEQANEAFVTDRTPLDDVAYAMLHCPESVVPAFLDRAIRHLFHYDLVVFAPLSAGQWLGDDPAREGDESYYLRLDIAIRGLFDLAWSTLRDRDGLPPFMVLSGDELVWRKGLVERQIEAQLQEIL
jgi:hypothetical protein